MLLLLVPLACSGLPQDLRLSRGRVWRGSDAGQVDETFGWRFEQRQLVHRSARRNAGLERIGRRSENCVMAKGERLLPKRNAVEDILERLRAQSSKLRRRMMMLMTPPFLEISSYVELQFRPYFDSFFDQPQANDNR